MIIGLDISSIPYGTGVSNYTQNLVLNLLQSDTKNTYKLFYSSLRQNLPADFLQELKKYKNYKLYLYRFPPTILSILWNKLHILSIEHLIGQCDIFHCSDWTQPPTQQAKTTTTIHDLTPFIQPNWHHPLVVSTHRQKMSQAIKHCDHYICVSYNSQTDLHKLFPQTIDKSSVIYEACEDIYSPKLIKTSKHPFGNVPYFLAQGTREPRKNLTRTIQAFVRFKKENPNNKSILAVAGKYGWGEDLEIQQPQFIKILGYVSDEYLQQLHVHALALVCVSLYEGFGLPLVKSFACGVPVITGNLSSLPEITKDAGLIVNPYSTEAIKTAFVNISKTKTREDLAKKALLRAKDFSWQTTALKTLKLYQQLCASE